MNLQSFVPSFFRPKGIKSTYKRQTEKYHGTPSQGQKSQSQLDRYTILGPGELKSLLNQYSGFSGNVTKTTARGIPVAFFCVDKIGSMIAVNPRHVNRKTKQGRERARDHSQYRLIHSRPNPHWSQYLFDKSLIIYEQLWGNGFARIRRNKFTGDPESYWLWHPRGVTIGMIGGELYYRNAQTGETVHYSDMIDVCTTERDPVTFKGLSRIEQCRLAFRQGMSLDDFFNNFLENGTHLGLAISWPAGVKAGMVEDVKKQMEAENTGTAKAGKNLILGGGPTFEKIGMPLKDQQFIEAREFSDRQIGLIFGFRPGQIGSATGESFNSLFQYNLDFFQYPLLPIARAMEQEYDERIFTDEERGTGKSEVGRVYNKYDFKGLLLADPAARAELYKTLGPALSENDKLELEDMNTFDGGDTRLVPLSTTTLDKVIAGNPVSLNLPGTRPKSKSKNAKKSKKKKNGSNKNT